MRTRLGEIAVFAVLAVMPATAADAIVAVREHGRVVYVNQETPAPAIKASAETAVGDASECETTPRRYRYWSSKERRWKPIPTPSKAALHNACSAADDVNAAVAKSQARPMDADASWKPAAPLPPGQLNSLIEQAAAKHNVDANLLRAIIKQESNFNPRARSRKGAIGLMQLMPATARSLKVNPYDPAQNVDGGVRHFRSLLDNFGGDVELSLAAYNAGRGAVERKGGIPNYRETRNYVKSIKAMTGASTNGSRSAIKVTTDADGRRIYTNE